MLRRDERVPAADIATAVALLRAGELIAPPAEEGADR
jgi:hypothetical protein